MLVFKSFQKGWEEIDISRLIWLVLVASLINLILFLLQSLTVLFLGWKEIMELDISIFKGQESFV